MIVIAVLLIASPLQADVVPPAPQAAPTSSPTDAAIERVRAAYKGPSRSLQDPALRLTTADRHYVDRLTSQTDREIALVALLAPRRGPADGSKRAGRIGLGLAFLAAEIAAGGESTGYDERSYTLGPDAPHGASRRGRALDAMAWAGRLGICPAEYVRGLQRLPLNQRLPDGSLEPDLRSAVKDLGSAAYDLRPCRTDASARIQNHTEGEEQ